MSTESILTLVGIGVTLAVFALGIVVAVLGFLLSRQLRAIEEELAHIRPLEIRLTRVETVMGFAKQPTPIVKRIGDTPA